MTREERHIAVLSRLLENMDVYDSVQPTEERKKAIKAAIQALSQEPICDHDCEHCTWTECPIEPSDDAVCREAVDNYIVELLSGYLYDEERERLEKLSAYLWELPSVTQKSDNKYRKEAKRWKNKWLKSQKSGKWILLDECANSGYYCSECQKKLVKEGWSNTVKKINFCPNCGSRMVEPQESEDKE